MVNDWMGILEAAYRHELTEPEWLRGILEAAGPLLNHGLGAAALLYDASSGTNLVPIRLLSCHAPPGLHAEACMRILETSPANPAFLAATFTGQSSGLVPDTFGTPFPALLEHLKPHGVTGLLAINGIDSSLRGCLLMGNLPRGARIAARTRAMWGRISTHLATAYRLRRRLGAIDQTGTGVEVVMSPSGQIQYAEGPAAEPGARDASPLDRLSGREGQALAHAALGRSNKCIAHELGLSTSTVGVLLGRAAKKLAVHSRGDLIRTYQRATCPTPVTTWRRVVPSQPGNIS